MSSELVKNFAQLFTGHKGNFVVHKPPFTRVETKNGIKVKAEKVYYRKSRKDGEFVPLDLDDYERHLEGTMGLAVSPLTADGEGVRDSCFFAVIDIDVYDSDVTIEQIEELFSEFPCVIRRSKSQGFHIFFFFKEKESAAEVRPILKMIAYTRGLYILFPGRVEVFPEYDLTTDKNAHCLFLPLFGAEEKEIKALLREAKKKMTTAATLERTASSSRFNFLPVCIEAKLNAHIIHPLQNRNNFLFSVAVFLVSTYPERAESLLNTVAELFINEDFNEEEIKTTFESANKKTYSFLGRCKTEELKSICDKHLCKERVFEGGSGVLEDTKNRTLTNVDFGQLYKYNALKPFYIWEIKKSGSEGDYIKVQFNDIQEMLNQKLAQAIIGEAVDTIFLTIKPVIWERHIENALNNMVILEVNLLADSSEMAFTVRLLYQYIMELVSPYDEPASIFQGRVYKKDDAYYFMVESAIAYLYAKGHGGKKLNLYAALSHIGASTTSFQNIEVWQFYENHTFREMIKSREKVRAIEKAALTTEIKGRFIDEGK